MDRIRKRERPAKTRGIQAVALALLLAGAAGVACGTSSPPPQPPETPAADLSPPPPPLDVFSADRAWEDLLALASPFPSEDGSVASAAARAHLSTALTALDLEVEEIREAPETEMMLAVGEVEPVVGAEPVLELGIETPEAPGFALRHVVATLPGASPDLFVLVAPYGGDATAPPPLGGNVGASGAALLLELARVLSTRTLPYTTRLVFLEGEAGADPPELRWRSSRWMAERMQANGDLARTRLLVVFDRVCDADLRIARDLASHRLYREEFFKAATRLQQADAFPGGQAFEVVEASHTAFLERGLRASVAIVDTGSPGGDVPESEATALPGDVGRCMPESLEAVGVVALEALDTIGARLARIDRFSRSPLAGIGPSGATAAIPPVAEPSVEDDTAPPPEEPPALGASGAPD